MKYYKVTRSDATNDELPRVIALPDSAVISGATITLDELTREEAEASINDDSVETDFSIEEGIASREGAIKKVMGFGQDVREQTVAGAHYITIGLWIMKAIRAERYLAGNATDRDKALLQLEVDTRGRGETIDELAAKIDANSIHLQTSGVLTEGMEKAAGDALRASDPDQIDTVMGAVMAQAATELTKVADGSGLDNADSIKQNLGGLIDKTKG